MKPWIQVIANYLEENQPINGSWLQAIVNALANLPQPINTLEVDTFNDLPDPAKNINEFAWVKNSSGISWIPTWAGGNYKNKGLYRSDGTEWVTAPLPFQATLAEVIDGTNNDKFITPYTYNQLKPIRLGDDSVENANKISVMDLTEYNLISPDTDTIYIVEELGTGWERYVDTVSTQSLTGNTNNTFDITGTQLSNGGLTLINTTTDKVQPLKLNDFLIVDCAFTVVTPSGSDNFIDVQFVVNGVVYGASTNLLLKGSGNDDHIRVSFGFPVESTFLVNGGTFNLVPNTNMTIKNKYISVTRTHIGE